MKKSVVLVDDHVAIRQMLARLLHTDPGYEVTGEAGSGLQAMELCRRSEPALVILDLVLPELCGIEVLRRIRAEMPQVRVMVFSGTVDRCLTIRALQCRPHGFIAKGDSLQTFVEGVRIVGGGGTYFTPFATALIPSTWEGPPQELTAREREILQLVAESRSSKEIADRLGVAVKTVENHRAHIMQKLQRHDVAALTRYAVQQGLVS
jgi:DNA-binding NarL/FixJ family response regulator